MRTSCPADRPQGPRNRSTLPSLSTMVHGMAHPIRLLRLTWYRMRKCCPDTDAQPGTLSSFPAAGGAQLFEARRHHAKLDSLDIDGYRSALNQQIALKIRNYFFNEEARKRKLDKTPTVQKQLEMWRNKWVYEEARQHYTENLTIDEEEARAYFFKYKDKYKMRKDDEPTFMQFAVEAKRDAYRQRALATLERKIDSLKTYYPISINHDVLDTIKVIDFKKSKWISMQAFKKGSNRLVVPIVDPAWIY